MISKEKAIEILEMVSKAAARNSRSYFVEKIKEVIDYIENSKK